MNLVDKEKYDSDSNASIISEISFSKSIRDAIECLSSISLNNQVSY